MPKFETIGRKIDQEIERLRDVAESKLSPRTRSKTAQALRKVSQRLVRLAEDLESSSEPREV